MSSLLRRLAVHSSASGWRLQGFVAAARPSRWPRC